MHHNRVLGAFFALLLTLVPFASPAASQGDDILPFKATTKTLPCSAITRASMARPRASMPSSFTRSMFT